MRNTHGLLFALVLMVLPLAIATADVYETNDDGVAIVTVPEYMKQYLLGAGVPEDVVENAAASRELSNAIWSLQDEASVWFEDKTRYDDVLTLVSRALSGATNNGHDAATITVGTLTWSRELTPD